MCMVKFKKKKVCSHCLDMRATNHTLRNEMHNKRVEDNFAKYINCTARFSYS